MSVFIQAIAWDSRRAANARKLARLTGGTIVWDSDHSGGLSTFLRVLEAMAGSDHGGGWIMEDDVELCNDWCARAAAVVADHPRKVIRAFSLTTTCGEIPGLGFYSTACSYFPPGAPRMILDFYENLNPHIRRHEALEQLHDHLVGLWLDSRGDTYWLHSPSLVQHKAWPSTIDPYGRELIRRSPTFVK